MGTEQEFYKDMQKASLLIEKTNSNIEMKRQLESLGFSKWELNALTCDIDFEKRGKKMSIKLDMDERYYLWHNYKRRLKYAKKKGLGILTN